MTPQAEAFSNGIVGGGCSWRILHWNRSTRLASSFPNQHAGRAPTTLPTQDVALAALIAGKTHPITFSGLCHRTSMLLSSQFTCLRRNYRARSAPLLGTFRKRATTAPRMNASESARPWTRSGDHQCHSIEMPTAMSTYGVLDYDERMGPSRRWFSPTTSYIPIGAMGAPRGQSA